MMREISIFNYESKPVRTKEDKQRRTNKFLDETYNYNIFWDTKDGMSGIDRALAKKHKIKGGYQSKQAIKNARYQSIL
jgi:hypothetical protein